MLFLKACKRCGGDMHINRDIYGEYKECLQCGLMLDIVSSNDVLAAAMAEPKKSKKKVA